MFPQMQSGTPWSLVASTKSFYCSLYASFVCGVHVVGWVLAALTVQRGSCYNGINAINAKIYQHAM